MYDDRGTGKTTRLIEEAVSLVAELPEGSFVFVTGAHSKWLLQLSREFKASGLSDVIFLTPQQILNGALRGRRGVLLIDDYPDLPMREMIILKEEASILRRH